MCAIIDLPESGEVMTLWGWKKYQNPRMTRENAELVEVEFADGTIVQCTPDHEFLSNKGWVQARDMDEHTLIRSSLTSATKSLLESSMSSTLESAITQPARAVREAIESIVTFGSSCMETFRRSITSITKTAIQPTIDSITLSACQDVSICPAIGMTKSENGLETTFRLPLVPLLQSGTDRQKAGNGTATWQEQQSLGRKYSDLKSLASSAAKFLWALTEQSSAATTAKQSITGQGQIPSWLRIKRVSRLEQRQNVYCLTVPDAAHFSLSNGAIVSNCIDALRYALEGARRARPAPIAKPKLARPLIWAG
jgi:major membrane immunogen (membrane-anchored lipoprotein)